MVAMQNIKNGPKIKPGERTHNAELNCCEGLNDDPAENSGIDSI